MKNLKKFTCLLLCLAIVFSMAGWTTGDVWSPEEYPIVWDCSNPKCMHKGNTGETCEGQDRTTREPCTQVRENAAKVYPFDAAKNKVLADGVVAENENYQLRWIPELNGSKVGFVELISKATGDRWGATSNMDGELTTIEQDGKEIVAIVNENGEMVDLPKPAVCSSIIVKALDNTNNQPTEYYSLVSAVKTDYIVTEKITNGIRIKYYFNDIQIMIPVEYVLREDSVAVTVNPAEIRENDRFNAVEIKINPYWCSNLNDTEGDYLFYPSGSGALVNNESVSSAGTTIEDPVYGFDPAMIRYNIESTEKEIRMPVYGAKTGDTAICAIIEQTPESANIGVKVGAIGTGYSTAYASYQVRGYSINKAQTLNNGTSDIDVYSLSPCDKPMTIGFYPLTGEKANYNGMAQTYKTYLKESGKLNKLTDDSPLNLVFSGGVMVNKSFLGIPYTDLVAATTIGEAQEIITDVKGNTGAKISAKLVGFGTTGVELGAYAGGMKINRNLGKLKDLDALNKYCGENGVDLYFDFDLIKLKSNSAGFSKSFDTAYNSILKTAEAYKYNVATRARIMETSYGLLSRPLLMEGAEKLLKKTAKWNLDGISIGDLGCSAYSDYSTETTDYFVKGGMPQDVAAIADKLSDKYKIASADANDYAAAVSNIVYNVPMVSSQHIMFDYDVPFYQMVFKGYVPLAGETMNTAVNPNTHKLKTVESGLGLNYTVINKYYNEFIDYRGYNFYGSEYEGIKDSIKETYGELKDYYAAINGAEIVSHKILDSGLRETVFSNGVKAYVNYTDASIAAPSGATVEADSYVWEK